MGYIYIIEQREREMQQIKFIWNSGCTYELVAQEIAGRYAYLAGLKPKDCPFALQDNARSWWMKGYHEAKQTRRKYR